VAVVVPLREGAYAAARGLLADGPPFDPEGLGLERHHVIPEAVFVFECQRGREGFKALIRDPALWQAAPGWHELASGPPRLAENMFSWVRPGSRVDATILPPGLHTTRE
jgi:hypothetical protein